MDYHKPVRAAQHRCLTTTHNEFVGIYSTEEEAMKMADWLEATDKYPIDSLYVDDYYVE